MVVYKYVFLNGVSGWCPFTRMRLASIDLLPFLLRAWDHKQKVVPPRMLSIQMMFQVFGSTEVQLRPFELHGCL